MSTSAPRLSLDGLARVGWSERRGREILQIEADRLVLRCVRTYSFTSDQVVAVERCESPRLDAAVRILHNRNDCPRQMTFSWHGGDDDVFALLARAGFVPCGTGPAGRPSLHVWARVYARVALVLIAVQVIGTVLFKLFR